MRSLAYWKLPDSSSEVIDGVPLVGQRYRAEKFLLGELVSHKGKTIDDLIKESVNHHLESSNYNNTDQLARVLSSVGIETQPLQGHFTVIDELMQRRHQIVHRADRDETGGPGKHKVKSISKSQIASWVQAVDSFTKDVLNLV